MTLDEVLALKQEMEETFQEPPRASLGLVQRWIDEGRATRFVGGLLDTPARVLPVLFETTEPALINACWTGQRPRGDFVHAALLAHGHRDEKARPHLSVGYSAVRKNNYRAEVRFQNPDVHTVLLAHEIVHRTKGQARIGEYRDLCAHAGKPAESGSEGLLVGSSVGHRKSPAGTLGLFLKSAEGVGIVSNSHILAWCGRARAGDPIFAPHPDDSKQARQIGKLRRFSKLINDDVVALDVAFALLEKELPNHGNVVPAGMPDAGKSIKAGEPLPVESIGLKVTKIGRTSHSTSGVVAAFNVGPKLLYAGLGEVKLTGMLEVQWPSPKKAFSKGGDSGSVVYRPDTMEAIGLVVGGGVRIVDGVEQGVTIVCPLTPAMTKWSLSPL
jgi:hypothetical protein